MTASRPDLAAIRARANAGEPCWPEVNVLLAYIEAIEAEHKALRTAFDRICGLIEAANKQGVPPDRCQDPLSPPASPPHVEAQGIFHVPSEHMSTHCKACGARLDAGSKAK